MKRTYLNILLSLTLLAGLLGACVKEDLAGGGADLGDEVEVNFTYRVDGMQTVSVTRITELYESNLALAFIFVYEVGTDGVERLAYIRPGNTISADRATGTGSFKCRLAKSRSNEKYTYDVLANVNLTPNMLGGLQNGMTRQQIREYLSNPSYSPTSTMIAMSAGIKKEDAIVIDASTTLHLNFVRSVLRVDVGLNLGENDETAAGLDNFTFTRLNIRSGAGIGYYIADPENIAPDGRVLAPSNTPYSPSLSNTYLVTNNALIRECYLFEPDVNLVYSNTTFVMVLEGTYTDENGVSSTRFYPVRLRDPNDPEKYLTLLRNHKYRINVKAITGPGYPDVVSAARGGELHIVYQLSVNSAGDINHVVYSGQEFLGVSQLYYEMPGSMAQMGEVKVMTSYAGGWTQKLTDADGNTPANNLFRASTSGNTSSNTVGTSTFTLVAQNISDPKTYYITFSAANLSIKVTVLQNGEWFISSDYKPGSRIRGDGAQVGINLWGNVPDPVWVRAYSPEFEEYTTRLFIDNKIDELPVSPAVSRDTLVFAGGVYDEATPISDVLDIMANAMVTNIERQVEFQYSTDNGATWVKFDEGLQGKGHFHLPTDGDVPGHTGRMVALYNMVDPYYWAEAMGIDPSYNAAFYYSVWQPGAYTGNDGSDLARYWRANYGYVPTHATGCGSYSEEGYPEFDGKWRLPSMEEMNQMSIYNLHIGDLPTEIYYWSSNEDTGSIAYSTNGHKIKLIGPDAGLGNRSTYEYQDKQFEPLAVRCVYGDPVVNVPQ
ncbi:MAG: Mfa1 fimbrilin C-terminal domain-containing protein [Alistipes sp.]|nr:Mfa1 fimbrilin C-terminal domain-containing protein [Alistipes sp.]